MFTVSQPAEDLQLLTDEQLRTAAGLSADDASEDETLAELGLRVAAEISTYCNVRIGAGAAPTLRRETVTEIVRCRGLRQIVLSRRHEVSITSIVEDGTALEADDYEVDVESGLLFRLINDRRSIWIARKVVVVYQAGFETVPADLAGVASDLVRVRRSEAARDPLTRAEQTEVPDVLTERREYWVGTVPGSSSSAGLPADLAGRLRRFRNLAGIG